MVLHRSLGLHAEQLHFRRGGRRLLNGVSLSIHPGELVVLASDDGDGGAELMHLLLGLGPACASALWLDGRPLAAWPRRWRASMLALVPAPTGPALPCAVADVAALGLELRLCAFDSTDVPPRMRADRVHQALVQVGLDHLANHPCSALPTDEQQRALLARALVQGAQYLLVETPAQAAAWTLWPLLRELARQGLGVLARVPVVHSHSTAVAADRNVQLVRGRLVSMAPGPQHQPPQPNEPQPCGA